MPCRAVSGTPRCPGRMACVGRRQLRAAGSATARGAHPCPVKLTLSGTRLGPVPMTPAHTWRCRSTTCGASSLMSNGVPSCAGWGCRTRVFHRRTWLVAWQDTQARTGQGPFPFPQNRAPRQVLHCAPRKQNFPKAPGSRWSAAWSAPSLRGRRRGLGWTRPGAWGEASPSEAGMQAFGPPTPTKSDRPVGTQPKPDGGGMPQPTQPPVSGLNATAGLRHHSETADFQAPPSSLQTRAGVECVLWRTCVQAPDHRSRTRRMGAVVSPATHPSSPF